MKNNIRIFELLKFGCIHTDLEKKTFFEMNIKKSSHCQNLLEIF